MSAALNALYIPLPVFKAIVSGQSTTESGICTHTAEAALLGWLNDLREGAVEYSELSITGCIKGLDPEQVGTQTLAWVSTLGANEIRQVVHDSLYERQGNYPFCPFWHALKPSQASCLTGGIELGTFGLTMLVNVGVIDYEVTLPEDTVTLVQITRNLSYLDPDVLRDEVRNPTVVPYG
jgi:hypothetical protein